jgi:hypothetical protein
MSSTIYIADLVDISTSSISSGTANHDNDDDDDDDDYHNENQSIQNPDNVQFPDWQNLSAKEIYEALNPPSKAPKASRRNFLTRLECWQISYFVCLR